MIRARSSPDAYYRAKILGVVSTTTKASGGSGYQIYSRQPKLELAWLRIRPAFPLAADRRYYLLPTNRASSGSSLSILGVILPFASSLGEVDQAQEIAYNHASHGTDGFNKHIMDARMPTCREKLQRLK
jgi:hypothetical protein